MKTCSGQKTEAEGSARGIHQYYQLTDKNSRDISSNIWNFSRYLKMFCVFTRIPRLRAEPPTVFCGTMRGKMVHTVRQVLTGEELDEISATLEKSPRKYTTTCPANERYLCSRHKM